MKKWCSKSNKNGHWTDKNQEYKRWSHRCELATWINDKRFIPLSVMYLINDIYFERLQESHINCCDHTQKLNILRSAWSVAACALQTHCAALCLHALSYWVDKIFDNKPCLTVSLYFFAQISRQIAKITVDSHQEPLVLTILPFFVLLLFWIWVS